MCCSPLTDAASSGNLVRKDSSILSGSGWCTVSHCLSLAYAFARTRTCTSDSSGDWPFWPPWSILWRRRALSLQALPPGAAVYRSCDLLQVAADQAIDSAHLSAVRDQPSTRLSQIADQSSARTRASHSAATSVHVDNTRSPSWNGPLAPGANSDAQFARMAPSPPGAPANSNGAPPSFAYAAGLGETNEKLPADHAARAYVLRSGFTRDSQFDAPGRAVMRPQSSHAGEAWAMDAQREMHRHSMPSEGGAHKLVRTLSRCRAMSVEPPRMRHCGLWRDCATQQVESDAEIRAQILADQARRNLNRLNGALDGAHPVQLGAVGVAQDRRCDTHGISTRSLLDAVGSHRRARRAHTDCRQSNGRRPPA
jgi:hypothetical protein